MASDREFVAWLREEIRGYQESSLAHPPWLSQAEAIDQYERALAQAERDLGAE